MVQQPSIVSSKYGMIEATPLNPHTEVKVGFITKQKAIEIRLSSILKKFAIDQSRQELHQKDMLKTKLREWHFLAVAILPGEMKKQTIKMIDESQLRNMDLIKNEIEKLSEGTAVSETRSEQKNGVVEMANDRFDISNTASF